MLKVRKSILISLVILLALSFTACNLVKVDPEVDKKLVVAKVNGEEILKEEYLDQLEASKQNIKSQYGIEELDDDMLESIREDVIDGMITKILLLQKVKEKNIELSEQDNKNIEEYLEYIKQASGGEDQFKELLEEQDVTEEQILNDFKESEKINKLLDDLTKDIDASEKEMKDFYDENKETLFKQSEQWETRHILIALPWIVDDEKQEPESEEEKNKEYDKIKPKAEEVLKKVKAGEDFAELAKQYSDDTSKDDGGLLPPFSTGQFVPEFEEATKQLKVGQTSDLVKTVNGYHIIKLEKTIPEKVSSYEEKEQEIKTYVIEQKKNELISKTLEDWKKKADIKRYKRNY